MTVFHCLAAAAPGGPPVPSGARPADRLDRLTDYVEDSDVHGEPVVVLLHTSEAVNLVHLAQAYRDDDDRTALACLQRLLGEDDDPDDPDDPDEWVADTTRRAQ